MNDQPQDGIPVTAFTAFVSGSKNVRDQSGPDLSAFLIKWIDGRSSDQVNAVTFKGASVGEIQKLAANSANLFCKAYMQNFNASFDEALKVLVGSIVDVMVGDRRRMF